MKNINLTEEEISILKIIIEGLDYDRWGFPKDQEEIIDNIYNKLE